jgi:hypothetical protein
MLAAANKLPFVPYALPVALLCALLACCKYNTRLTPVPAAAVYMGKMMTGEKHSFIDDAFCHDAGIDRGDFNYYGRNMLFTGNEPIHILFDANGDNIPDLCVCNGNSSPPPGGYVHNDLLYFSDSSGNFTNPVPLMGCTNLLDKHSSIAAADFDADGDIDLFVGTYSQPGMYGYACSSYILQNNGYGIFTDITASVCPGIIQCGVVTDACWIDYDKDGLPDLAVAGEYLNVKIFHNNGGRLEAGNMPGLQNSGGKWSRLHVADVNDDGYPDIVLQDRKNCRLVVALNNSKGDFVLMPLQ